ARYPPGSARPGVPAVSTPRRPRRRFAQRARPGSRRRPGLHPCPGRRTGIRRHPRRRRDLRVHTAASTTMTAVLIADPDRRTRRLTTTALRVAGYTVETT